MLHLHFNTGTRSARVEIQNNAMKLLFNCEYNVDTSVMLPPGPGLEGAAVLQIKAFAEAVNGRISITRYTKSRTEVMATNIKLVDLAEICANNEGVVHIKPVANVLVGNNPGVKCRAQFSIELSNAGAIYSDKTDFLVVELEGFQKYNSGLLTDQTADIDVSSIGSFVGTSEYIVYDPLALNANQLQSYTCDGASMVALPETTARALMHSATSELFEVRAAELSILAADVNDTVYLVDGYPVPFYNWRLVPIQLAQRIQIESPVPATAYLISNKSI